MGTNLKITTLKKQILIMAGVTLLIAVVLIAFINSGFLEGFYTSRREASLTGVFDALKQSSDNKELYDDAYGDKFVTMCERENVACIVIRPDGRIMLSTENDNSRITNHLYEILFYGKAEDSGNKNKGYYITPFTDTLRDSEYLVLWGSLSDGNTVIMETVMESVTDMIRLARSIIIVASIFLIVLWIGMSSLITVRNLRRTTEKLYEDIRIREKNESMRREFISNVSHELKTPISLILGYSEGLLEDEIIDSKEKRKHYAEVIVDEASKMDVMISGLLNLNELEYGNKNIDIKPLNFEKIVNEELEGLLILAQNADVNLVNRIPKDTVIYSDDALARQVVVNYITNAIRYCDNEKCVRIDAVTENNRVKFSVFNTGEGLQEEELHRIWEKFYKIDKARTREVNSSGIGLSLVKAAAKTLETECGAMNVAEGIEFYFIFNAKEA